MSSYASQIESVISREPVNHILEASALYRRSFQEIPERTYYKTLERMCRKGTLIHLTKGLYYRPEISRFGTVPISEDDIIQHYTEAGKGVIIGYRLYNEKGLTTQIGKRVELLSSALTEDKKNILNVSVMNLRFDLTDETKCFIETMEILQNCRTIENLNKPVLAAYMRQFSAGYSDAAAHYVLDNRRYRKSSIALLRRFLTYHGTENTLDTYLSALSSYDIPEMEEFYESA